MPWKALINEGLHSYKGSEVGEWEGCSDSHGVRLREGFKKGLEDNHC